MWMLGWLWDHVVDHQLTTPRVSSWPSSHSPGACLQQFHDLRSISPRSMQNEWYLFHWKWQALGFGLYLSFWIVRACSSYAASLKIRLSWARYPAVSVTEKIFQASCAITIKYPEVSCQKFNCVALCKSFDPEKPLKKINCVVNHRIYTHWRYL